MLAWIVAAFYLAGIIAAVDAIMNTRTPQGAIASSVSFFTAPFVAIPAYLVLGRSTFEGMTAVYQQRRQEIDALPRQFGQMDIRESAAPGSGLAHPSRAAARRRST